MICTLCYEIDMANGIICSHTHTMRERKRDFFKLKSFVLLDF